SFTVSNSCYNNAPTRFTNTTVISGDAVNYEWYFGNGNSSVSVNPTEFYTINGSYDIKLIASSAHGCIDSVKQTINLEKATAAFTINSTSLQCLKDNSFTFTNQSHATTSDLNYQWNLAEGTNSIATSPVKSYTTAGTYNVRLIAKIGINGCADTLVKSLTVYPMPVANFATTLITATGFSSNIQFNNTSTVSSGHNNYSWFFTDGTSSVATSLSHQFASIPTMQVVKLIAITNNGCADSISKNVSLLNGVSTVIVNGAISNLSAAPTDNLAVFPNPVISVAQVNVATVGNQLIIVTVSDYNGRVVFQTRQTTNNTNTRVSINLQSLVPGTYLVDARSGSGTRLGSQIITKVN
ncbi:MAG: PKD domain-containing protein, partial [Pedobacter sp.]|nr:PKD domain-containing protein [Chitinophagaceae bacterium]